MGWTGKEVVVPGKSSWSKTEYVYMCDYCGKEFNSNGCNHRNRLRREKDGGTGKTFDKYACYAAWSKEVGRQNKNIARVYKYRVIASGGYIRIRVTEGTPGSIVQYKNKAKTKYVVTMMEHRYVYQNYLLSTIGKPLNSDIQIHHKNGNRQDNRLENLEPRPGPHGSGSTLLSELITKLQEENASLKKQLLEMPPTRDCCIRIRR